MSVASGKGDATLTVVTPVNSSKDPESTVRVGDWVWVQYEKEDGGLDNNLALVVVILLYGDGEVDVAILWGKETQHGSNARGQRVVCTDDCWIVEKESIGGRVIERESCARVVTENSAGEVFSLDKYHILLSSNGRLEVGDHEVHCNTC